MKKQSLHRKNWLLRRSIRIQRKKKRRKLYKHRSFAQRPVPSRYKGKGLGVNSLTLPTEMNFDKKCRDTLKIFRSIRRVARGEVPIDYIDFDKLSEISAEAAVVLASEIDLWDQRLGRKLKATTSGWDFKVKELLREMGFFDLLNVDKHQHVVVDKKTVFLRIVSADLEKERNGGLLAVELREQIKKFTQHIDELKLYEALSEALMNVIHHAYSGGADYKTKLFWMSASYELDTGKLSVVFYDQGRGISRTVKSMGYYERFRDKLPADFMKLSDANKLKALVMKPRSQSDIQGRGNGIPKMIELARGDRGNSFTIISRNGCCITRLEDGHVAESSAVSLPSSLRGTLIS